MSMRTCYPRPDFARESWMGLNGAWRFAFDDENVGLAQQWMLSPEKLNRTIEVPFTYQSKLSGIGETAYHETLWYAKEFHALPEKPAKERTMLHFGAVDWHCDVWVNGCHVCTHDGGYTPFSVDITDALTSREKAQTLVLRVEDSDRCDQPRGKQSWQEEPDRCWYTPCSGIWQSVWLESVPKEHLLSFSILPDLETSAAHCTLVLNQKPKRAGRLEAEVRYLGKRVALLALEIGKACTSFSIPIQEADYVDEIHYWTPETPNLYDVSLTYDGEEGVDHVKTYFGMRSVHVENGKVLLNNRPFYQRLLLHQGYYEGGLLTAEKDDDYRSDLQLIKDMGFNGIRLHQKIEDPLLYYWADRLGLVVWGELPSCYEFNQVAMKRSLRMLEDFVLRDFNHPCILCWVPFNESWGVRNIYGSKVQQRYAMSAYHLLKALDDSRLVSTNDGWEQVGSDLCCIHDYAPNAAALKQKWEQIDALVKSDAQGRMVYADSYRYEGQPVVLSEFGGIAYKTRACEKDWGYCGVEQTEEAFLARLTALLLYVRSHPQLQGFCYTQFTDVEQEINGLADSARTPKVSVEKLRSIFG